MKALILLLSLTFLGIVYGAGPVATFHKFEDYIGEMKYLDHKNVLILSNGKLFRSTTGGKAWQTVSLPSISNYAEASTSGDSIHVSNKGHVFLRGNKASIWVSSDYAKTWKAVKTSGHFDTVEWHARESGWALATTTKDNHSTYEVYVTLDYGQSWKKVAENVIMSEAYWGDAGLGQVNSRRIYFIQERTPKDLTHFHLCFTDDFGDSSVVINKQTITAVFRPNHIFVLSYSDDYSEIFLRVSPDVGVPYDKVFMRAEFPWGEELENSLYSIEDDTYGNVWMGVNHGHTHSSWGHLYHSEPMGVMYTLSVPFVYFAWPLFDFHRIQGMDGVYLVNTLEDPDNEWDHRIQTWITHDQGRNWGFIEPPASHTYHCEDSSHCALHIHGWSGHWTGTFGPFYSARNALGIVIGNGNVGEHLSLEADVHTFISSDGGNTWKQILPFPSIYEISNHGGVIVFAQLDTPTKKVHYTTDYGATVQELDLPQTVEVRNIVAEPSLSGAQFILEDFDGESVIHLDFESYMGSACQKKDHEEWKPFNPNTQYHNGKECLMGGTSTFSRRKQNVKCLLPNDYDSTRVTHFQPCTCTDWDFVCDFGYYHSHNDPETGDKYCIRDPTVELHDPPLWCVPGRKYYITDGYVKESGNTCEGGVTHRREERSCPGTRIEDFETQPGSSSKAGWVAVIIIIPVVALILVAAYYAMNNEELREKFPVLQSLFNLKEGYSRMGQPGNQPGALFDDEEYIIGSLDDRTEDEETGELKTVDLNSTTVHSEALNSDLEEFDPRK